MKFKFNLKLTTFLVSLFIGLLLIILGSGNKYCLSFGFIVIGLSLPVFVWYNNEKTRKEYDELSKLIEEIEQDLDVEDQEQMFALSQVYVARKKVERNKHKSVILFYSCGIMLLILGFIGMF